MNAWVRSCWLACLLFASSSLTARAQLLRSEPFVLGDGRATVSADISASVGTADHGFFNYTDYARSTLRLFRVDVTGAARAGKRLSFLGELRSENLSSPAVYSLYARLRPWVRHELDIQVGRIPPTFGAFPRRTYAADNPLIGYPLAYQYLTSLRPDALPGNADELLLMRGRGWLASYSVGSPVADHGVPLASAFKWDTGIQVHAAGTWIEGTVALTAGTIANPLFRDDNAGRQIAGRAVVRPATGLVLGVSAARGPFVTSTAARSAQVESRGGDFTQTAWGGDIEYSRGYYLLRAETVFSRWVLPALGEPAITEPLRATGVTVEGRYKVTPGFYVAARADHLGFSMLTGSLGRRTWDAPVTRLEVGGGYSLERNLLAKLSFQLNRRDGGRERTGHFVATQLVFWF